MESIQLTTIDGHHLAGDVAPPLGGYRGGAVICHPHPQFGGDRSNPIVDAVFRRLPRDGFRTLRFDFRDEFDDGVGERNDVHAAVDWLDARSEPDGGPLVLVGYSFGAVVAINSADARVSAIVAIAPPLAVMATTHPTVPTLVITPQHDQYTPPEVARDVIGEWSSAELSIAESADHFLVGRATWVADAAAEWLAARR